MCMMDIKNLHLNLSIEQIKTMKLSQYKSLVKKKIQEESFKYLNNKRRKKGCEIQYDRLQTAEYILPNNYINTIEDQQLLFALRNKTYKLTNDYQKEICVCKKEENLAHIYECTLLNFNTIVINYNKIYNGTLIEQKLILQRMKKCLQKREEFKTNVPRRHLQSTST